MTTVSPSPNWYADPTGRHEARYWDGFTWTAHVADHGTPGVDPLVRRAPVAAAAPEPTTTEPVGPGTAALRTMAETRTAVPAPEPDAADGAGPPAPAPRVRAPRRRSITYDVCVVLAAILVMALGGYVLWSRWLDSSTDGGTDPRGAVTWRHDGYRVALPPSWVEAGIPTGASPTVDGRFQVIDPGRIDALVGDEPASLASLSDPERVVQAMTAGLDADAAAAGGTVVVISSEVLVRGDRFVGVLVADVTDPEARTARVVEHLVVMRPGSVAITLVGDAAAVERHRDDGLTAAKRVAFR